MTTPAVQRLGAAALLQGPALAETAYLLHLGIRYRANIDGAVASDRQRALLRVLTDTAEATLACGHADTHPPPGVAGSLTVGEIGTAEVARVLGITPRHARRFAVDLDGRRVKGTWLFDRAAVVAYVAERREDTENG